MNKPDPNSFAEKISALQRDQLIDWLADHSYPEVVELVAVPPPEGFGLEVSTSTICRFYKANFNRIAQVRQDKLSGRGADQRHYGDTLDQFYRQNLTHGAEISLLERYYELLSQPVENVDQLKKLVYISRQIKELEIPLDPEEVQKNEALKLLLGHPFDRYMKNNADRFKVQRPDANAPSNISRVPNTSHPSAPSDGAQET
jgi:hypothetical protein